MSKWSVWFVQPDKRPREMLGFDDESKAVAFVRDQRRISRRMGQNVKFYVQGSGYPAGTTLAAENPMDPNNRILLTGGLLVASAVGIALFFLSQKAAASPSTPPSPSPTPTPTPSSGGATAPSAATYQLSTSNAGGTTNAHVGDTVVVSLPPTSAPTIYSWQATVAGNVLTGPQTSSSASGETDTFQVSATGTGTIMYTSATTAGVPDPTASTYTFNFAVT